MIELELPIVGTFVKRYKRFFCDIQLKNGEIITAHLANTGSMKSLLLEGTRVYCSASDNPKRKLKYSVQILELPTGALACVNTHLANHLVKSAIENGKIKELSAKEVLKSEVKTSKHTRLDLSVGTTLVEVKSVTLLSDDQKTLLFPDAVTSRGLKHIHELESIVKDGFRAVLFFLVNRSDGDRMDLANEIDSNYVEALKTAQSLGVEVLVYRIHFKWKQKKMELSVEGEVPFQISN